MDRDSNDEIASHIVNGVVGGIFFLGGLSMIIWGWGPGTMGGLPLMLGGLGYPLLKAYLAGKEKDHQATRRVDRAPTDGYEIRTAKFKESRRR